MCPIHDMKRSVGFMQPAVFEKIITEISPYAELVYLIGEGEPLLNKYFIDYLSELKKRKIFAGTSTNAMLLTAEISEKLLLNDISYIIFPLDGITKKTYEAIRVNADFDVVLENIRQFLLLKQRLKKKTFVQLQMISMEKNMEDVKHFSDFIKKLDAHNQVNDIRIKPVIDFSMKNKDREGEALRLQDACFLLWRNMFISHDGIPFVCCQDTNGAIPIGDFKKECLEEIWNSPKMRSFRKLHVQGERGKSSLCVNCDLDQRYFNLLAVAATSFFNAGRLKRYISYYEKYMLGSSKDRKKQN